MLLVYLTTLSQDYIYAVYDVNIKSAMPYASTQTIVNKNIA